MKLSSRLSLVVTAVSAAVLLTCFVTAYLFVDIYERRELDVAMVVQARAFAEQGSRTWSPKLDGTASIPESLKQFPHYVAIYSSSGQVLSATKNLSERVPPIKEFGLASPLPSDGETFNLRLGDTALRAIAIPLEGGAQTLVYALPSRSVDKDSEFLRQTLGLLFFSAVLGTWLFSRWLGGRLAGDVHRIAGVARQVATGDFRARVGHSTSGSQETQSLGEDLDRMIEQLGHLLDVQRVFVSHAAHEFRSPLTTLHGELQLALRRPRTAEEYRTTIARSLEDVEALMALAEDLLSLARAQATTDEERTSTVDALLTAAMRASKGLADVRGVTIASEPLSRDVASVQVRGAVGDLARALRNLIDNAVQHSRPEGSVRVTVSVEGRSIAIAVEDAGPGIAVEDVSGIFEPFYRAATDQAADRNGAGLGLPIAQKIVQTANGDIRLDRAYSTGARFVMSLPMVLSDR